MLNQLKQKFITASNGLGRIVCYESYLPGLNLARIIQQNKIAIEELLLTYGGVLFRGFNIRSVTEFESLAKIVAPHLLDYKFRSTPRTQVEGKIYTSTEYPANRFIQFHNECSYSSSWPNKILFFCVIPSIKGGETALADSRHVYNKINIKVREKFDRTGITYVRNYIQGLDISWREVFQTSHKSEVEQYCNNYGISYEWKSGLIELTTKQTTQATLSHYKTGEHIWFNQAHMFHSSSLQPNEKSALLNLLGADQNLPRNVLTGNNESIDDNDFEHIRATYESERIEFAWQKYDLLLLDNILMAHSRNPFEGDRKIVVAMGS